MSKKSENALRFGNKSKAFFFEKKNQKTFAPLRTVVKKPEDKINSAFFFVCLFEKVGVAFRVLFFRGILLWMN